MGLGDSFAKSGNGQEMMESEYEFEESIDFGPSRPKKFMLSQMMYSGDEHPSKAKQKRESRISTQENNILRHSVGKRHNVLLKAMFVYLQMIDKLEALFDRTKSKTVLYILTLFVSRISHWNTTILTPLKQKKAYFNDGNFDLKSFPS